MWHHAGPKVTRRRCLLTVETQIPCSLQEKQTPKLQPATEWRALLWLIRATSGIEARGREARARGKAKARGAKAEGETLSSQKRSDGWRVLAWLLIGRGTPFHPMAPTLSS